MRVVLFLVRGGRGVAKSLAATAQIKQDIQLELNALVALYPFFALTGTIQLALIIFTAIVVITIEIPEKILLLIGMMLIID